MNLFNQIIEEGTCKLYLYGDIGGEKVDSERIVTELITLSATYDKIEIHINSSGGEVFSGIAIFNALRSCKADITLYIDALAASIAGIIALCGKPLYMSQYARLMLHNISCGCMGNKQELRSTADLVEGLEKDVAKMIASRTGMTEEECVKTYFDGKDHWITAKQALELKLIDGIIEDKEIEPSDDVENISAQFTNRLRMKAQKNNDMALFDELKKRPVFSACTDDTAVIRMISTLENKAVKVDALETKVTELTLQLKEVKASAHKTLVDAAIESKKITEAQRETFMNLLSSDETNTKKLLESMPGKNYPLITDYLESGKNGKGGAPDLLTMSWDEIDKADRLQELKEKYPDAFKAKFNAKFNK